MNSISEYKNTNSRNIKNLSKDLNTNRIYAMVTIKNNKAVRSIILLLT